MHKSQIKRQREMQRSRTTENLLLVFILGAHFFTFAAPAVVTSSLSVDTLADAIQSVHIIDEAKAEDNESRVISYRSFNHGSEKTNVTDPLVIEIIVDQSKLQGYDADNILVTTTYSRSSCGASEESRLHAWKIDKGFNASRIHLIINEGKKSLDGSRLFLCVLDTITEKFRHLGNTSRLLFDSHGITKRQTVAVESLIIVGFRIEHADKEPSIENGVPILRAGSTVSLRLFGQGFTEMTHIGLSPEKLDYGGVCNMMIGTGFRVHFTSAENVVVDVLLPMSTVELYFCATNDATYHHQGIDAWMIIKSQEPLLPIWVQVIIIFVCLCFSALFSGLNLGLMSLDRTDLKILCNTGSDIEKVYANAIQPVRDHGNFLLCSILLGNVLVNSTFTILLDSLTSGLIAILCSTLLIVIFGEITPQAICSRHGLAVGAKTILVTKFVMLITFPLSYPTSKILDRLLGEEIGTYYNRERLNELVKVTKDHNDLDKDEVNIISGVLEMRKKAVGDIMTPIDDAYMLSIDSILDFETVSKIMNSGYSRIPVYENDRKNILSLLYIKDLAFVDTDDNTPLRMLCEFYQNPCHFVFDDLTLDVMFKQFKEGNKGHMAFVHRVNNDGDGDPFYETTGLVTLEDVIEELIQAEIMDETDRITDNKTKNRRSRQQNQDFSFFVDRRPETNRVHISPQLTLAAFQFLSTTLEPFRRGCISESILRRLLNQDIVRHCKVKSKSKNDPTIVIFHQGKPVDFFVLILEGRVEVTVGKENLVFESGPFTHFGLQALAQNVGFDSPQQQVAQSQVQGSLQSLNMDAMLRHTFIPDYSVKALTDVVYIVVKRTLYLAAKRATLMEHSRRMGEHSSNEPFDDEVEKLLHSLDEDDSVVHTNLNSPRMSKPASPVSQQFSMAAKPSSTNQLHSESDGGVRVTFSQSNSNGNQVGNINNSQKTSVDIHDELESDVAHPLLNRLSNS